MKTQVLLPRITRETITELRFDKGEYGLAKDAARTFLLEQPDLSEYILEAEKTAGVGLGMFLAIATMLYSSLKVQMEKGE
jgi:hypothetical protein